MVSKVSLPVLVLAHGQDTPFLVGQVKGGNVAEAAIEVLQRQPHFMIGQKGNGAPFQVLLCQIMQLPAPRLLMLHVIIKHDHSPLLA